MRPITARLVGGAGAVTLALGLSFATHQNEAEAQSPVCFTIWGGDCYCIDFFFTKVKEKVVSQAQQYVNNLMGEFDDLRSVGIQDVLGDRVGNMHTYRDYLDEAKREAWDKVASERPMPSSSHIPIGTRKAMERDPEGKTVTGRQARAVATASASPEDMVPYSISREGGGGLDRAKVQDWTDRMVLEPGELSIPSNKDLAEMKMRDLLEMYDEARHALGGNYARYHMQELAKSEDRLQALEESRSRLEVGHLDQPGAIQSAALVAKTVSMAIETELLESQLRRQSLMASLVAMRVGGTDEAE